MTDRKSCNTKGRQEIHKMNVTSILDIQNYQSTILKTTLYLQKVNCMCIDNLQCRALAYMQTGKELEAVQDLAKILFLQGPAGPVFCNLGIILMRNKHYNEAIIGFNRAITQEPDNPSYRWNLAWTHSLLNNLPSAIFVGQKAIDMCKNIASLKRMQTEMKGTLSVWKEKLTMSSTTTSTSTPPATSASAPPVPSTTTVSTSPVSPSTDTSPP